VKTDDTCRTPSEIHSNRRCHCNTRWRILGTGTDGVDGVQALGTVMGLNICRLEENVVDWRA